MVFLRPAARNPGCRRTALAGALFVALATVPAAAAAPAPPDVPALLAAETGARARHAWADAIDDTDRVLEAEPDTIPALLDRAASEQALGCTTAA